MTSTGTMGTEAPAMFKAANLLHIPQSFYFNSEP